MGRPSKIDDDKTRARILMLVRGGNRLPAAAGACGVSRQTLHDWRSRAARGQRKYAAFFADVQRAIDEGEVADVVVTTRAANLDQVSVPCLKCGAPVKVTTPELVALAGDLVTAQHVKSSAAQVAFQRLALRDPKHWSPRVTMTVEEEHTRLLDVAERVLEPQAFKLLLEAYVASGSSEEPPAPAGSGSAPGRLH